MPEGYMWSEVEMAWATHGPQKWPLTVGFHGPVNSPNTFVFSWVPLQSANFFEALTWMMKKFFVTAVVISIALWWNLYRA